ncbi:MAG: hypothetical protein V1746_01515 [bacterium]
MKEEELSPMQSAPPPHLPVRPPPTLTSQNKNFPLPLQNFPLQNILEPPQGTNGAASKSGESVALCGAIHLPIRLVLTVMPDEVLADRREILLLSFRPEETFAFPMDSIIGMIPSRKLEFFAKEFADYLPAGVLRPLHELADAPSFTLPFDEVLQLIPRECLIGGVTSN